MGVDQPLGECQGCAQGHSVLYWVAVELPHHFYGCNIEILLPSFVRTSFLITVLCIWTGLARDTCQLLSSVIPSFLRDRF